MRERGLKQGSVTYTDENPLSLPMRERGLKQNEQTITRDYYRSLPMRERGLKQEEADNQKKAWEVAPHAGAWIETFVIRRSLMLYQGRSPCGSVD